MDEPLSKNSDPVMPEKILQRFAPSKAAADRKVPLINARLAAKSDEIANKLRRIQEEPGSKKTKVQKLWAIGSELSGMAEDEAACKKGCSHCCHISVALMQTEATVIGAKIGRPAKMLKESVRPGERGYGYHMPCPFLKDSSCSIYENRPLACRIQVNLDDDAMLCELLPGLAPPVPYLNLKYLQLLYAEVLGNDKIGDIRDFFPI